MGTGADAGADGGGRGVAGDGRGGVDVPGGGRVGGEGDGRRGGGGEGGGRAPRRRLDVDERRAAILAAAGGLYAVSRYSEVTVAQVAGAADASPALVFHYFGSKAGLYAEVVRAAVAGLSAAQREAAAALPPGTPARERVRRSALVYLDHVAAHPAAWAAPLDGAAEPEPALDVRRAAREAYVGALCALVRPSPTWPRHRYAVWGYFGFLDQACLRWVRDGCPPGERDALVEAALGALEGALGDWGG